MCAQSSAEYTVESVCIKKTTELVNIVRAHIRTERQCFEINRWKSQLLDVAVTSPALSYQSSIEYNYRKKDASSPYFLIGQRHQLDHVITDERDCCVRSSSTCIYKHTAFWLQLEDVRRASVYQLTTWFWRNWFIYTAHRTQISAVIGSFCIVLRNSIYNLSIVFLYYVYYCVILKKKKFANIYIYCNQKFPCYRYYHNNLTASTIVLALYSNFFIKFLRWLN